MNNASLEKAPRVLYVIIGFASLSLLMMLATGYSALSGQMPPGMASPSWIDNLMLAAAILFDSAFIFLLVKRSRAAFTLSILIFAMILCGVISPWISPSATPATTGALVGGVVSAIFYLLVVLKVREFCRIGLLR